MYIDKFPVWFGRFCSLFISFKLINKYNFWKDKFYNEIMKHAFQHFGTKSIICSYAKIVCGRKIVIGDNVGIGRYGVIEAYGPGETLITISDGCCLGDMNHLTAYTGIYLGKNVLTGRRVTISDNGHGTFDKSSLDTAPLKRTVYSKGGVKIGDNVWIGENCTILANVHIGNGAVIGANAVVTTDIPAYSCAVGVPAKVIKTLK